MSQHDRQIALMKFLSKFARDLGVGRDVYVVGGAVRSFAMGLPIKDLDIVVDSVNLGHGRDSEWFAKKLADAIPARTNLTTNQYGVAILSVKGEWVLEGIDLDGEVIEVANARKESYAGAGGKGKGYKPTDVVPATILDDVTRRDFGFNTLLWRLHDLVQGPDYAEIVDLTGVGKAQLENRLLNTPLDPDKTFSDDPTRMLRVIKFLLRFPLEIVPEVETSIRRNAHRLKDMPWEAVGNILVGDILKSAKATTGIRVMKSLGILDVLVEMIQETPPFAAYLTKQLANGNHSVELLLELADLGIAGRVLSFLTTEQRARFKELTQSMGGDESRQFLEVLRGPPVDNAALIQEFSLEGRDRGLLVPLAREAILQDPSLATHEVRLNDRVRETLRATRGSHTAHEVPMMKSSVQRVVAEHLESQDPLTALTDEVKGLESLASEIQAVVDTFLETVPMPHVGRIAALQLRSQTECFSKCEHAARHAQRVINQAFTILQTQPGNATAVAVVRDAGMLLEKFNAYRAKSREMLSAMAQKIMPTALKATVTYVLDEVRAALYEPNRVSVTVFPHYVPTKVGESMVDGMVFDAYLTVFPLPHETAPSYQQFVLTQSTLGDTGVYLLAIDRTNVNDPTKPVKVGAPSAVSKILGHLTGWDNLLTVHTTKMAARARKVITRELVEAMGAAEINKLLDALDKESSGITDEFIAAGRGNERPSEIIRMTDPLALRYIQNWKDADLLRDEVSRRYGPGAPRRLPRGFGPIKVAAARTVLTRDGVTKFLVTELKKIPGVKVKSTKTSIILVPGALNPLVKGIEITNLDLDNAPFRMTLTNGMIGWGWDAYRRPAPVFHDAHNTLRLGVVFDGKRDPAVELRAFIKNVLLIGIEKAGNVWNGTALVPMAMGKAPAPAKAPAAPAPVAPPPPAPKVDYLAAVTSALKGMRLGPVGGRILSVDFYPGASPSWVLEPSNRQRLDHYVGSGYRDRDDDDDDGDSEGWDSEGWEMDYAGPVSTAAYKWLATEFGPGLFYVEVGEKGHIDIQLTVEGRKKFLA